MAVISVLVHMTPQMILVNADLGVMDHLISRTKNATTAIRRVTFLASAQKNKRAVVVVAEKAALQAVVVETMGVNADL